MYKMVSTPSTGPSMIRLAQNLLSQEPATQSEAAANLRDHTFDKPNRVDLYQTPGLVAGLVKCFDSKDEDTQKNAACMLMYISGASENKVPMFKMAGLVTGLVKCIDSKDEPTRSSAVAALANLAAASENRVPMFKTEGLITGLVKYLDSDDLRTRANAKNALENLCIRSGILNEKSEFPLHHMSDHDLQAFTTTLKNLLENTNIKPASFHFLIKLLKWSFKNSNDLVRATLKRSFSTDFLESLKKRVTDKSDIARIQECQEILVAQTPTRTQGQYSLLINCEEPGTSDT